MGGAPAPVPISQVGWCERSRIGCALRGAQSGSPRPIRWCAHPPSWAASHIVMLMMNGGDGDDDDDDDDALPVASIVDCGPTPASYS
jgi:hypothetical protein